ncbi:MAG TPA: hypothetical protein VIN61_14650 [Gammaproteobacteria bacterium]
MCPQTAIQTSPPAVTVSDHDHVERDAACSSLDRLVGLFTAVRPGEGRSAALFFAYSFLLLVCYYVLKTIREPLLLANGSAELKSYGNAAIAGALLVLLPLYGALFRRAGKRQLVRAVTLAFSGTLVLFCVVARAGVDVGFVYYVWVGVFGVFMLAQFWAHAAHTYKVESGQRLFPVIMAGAAVGGLAGPPLCGVLFDALGVSNLMLLAAALLATTVPLVEWTWNAVPAASRNGEPRGEPKKDLLGGLSLVLRDRYLLLLAVLAVLLNCVSSTGDYLLTDFVVREADLRVAADPGLDKDSLIAAFYGNYYLTMNALGLLLQLLLVARVFRWVGVPGALLVLPAIALLGYGLVVLVPVFAVVQAVKLLESSTSYTLMNTARQALFLPLPAAHQYEGKTAIDCFFWRCGDLLQAGVIYVGLNALDFGFRELALTNVLLALAWIAVARAVGRRYAGHAPRRFAQRFTIEWRTVAVAASTAVAVVALASPRGVRAEEPAAATPTLFAAHEPLAVELRYDARELCRKPEREECADLPATLVYREDDGTERSLNVRLRARGKWRNQSGNCAVPPLFVFFDDEEASGTLFADQEMLPLTTHCRETASYEQYVLKEYLAYRIYNVLTPKSLSVRLMKVSYRDTGKRGRVVERYAFFTEHFESLARRQGAEHWPTDDFDPAQADARELATFELFEFMIGNTDWSAIKGHNVTHLRRADGTVTAVPFDFDFSGLVNASYAGPPPGLPIDSVRQRLFRGACRDGFGWDELVAAFVDRRPDIEALLAGLPGLTERSREETAEYVEEFFAIIASAERRQAAIVDACRSVR